MPDTKLSALTEISAPVPADFLYTIDAVPTSYKLSTSRLLGQINTLCQGRLTLTTAVPVTITDVTAATTVYFTPYNGNVISVYDGTRWRLYTFSEVSIAVPATTVTPFDVFIYDNAGTLTLETANWTNDTTRATALVLQNGVQVKSGAATRRYLGTGRTTGVSGQCEDSAVKRFLWNNHNRIHRKLLRVEATASWTYTSSVLRQANASTSNQVETVSGIADTVINLAVRVDLTNGTTDVGYVGIGIDSTTVDSADISGSGSGSSTSSPVHAELITYPAVGYHFYAWLEANSGSATSVTYRGTVGTRILSGLLGTIL